MNRFVRKPFTRSLLVLLLVASAVVACGEKHEPAQTATGGSGQTSTNTLTREQAIDIAAHHLIGKSFDVTPPATVTQSDGKYTVAFQRPVPNGAPGETYTSKVIFDAKTKEALEIVVHEDGKQATQAPVSAGSAGSAAAVKPEHRPTPLREEIDHTAELAKQLGVGYGGK